MIRAQHLIRGSQISISRFDHQPDADHTDPEEEVCSDYAVNFVEAGSFGVSARNERCLLFPGYVFFSQPRAVHSYTHHEKTPSDVCLSVVYSEALAEEIALRDHSGSNSFPLAIASTNRLAFLKLRLSQLLSDGYVLALEHWAVELMSAVQAYAPNGNRLYRKRQLRWYAERVEAVRELFETRFAESHSLTAVAKSVGISPFQFARVFSELTGLPPHQYLLAVRLDRAARMIRDGKPVTQTCFDVGFSNLSHFTRSFRRRFGFVPSSLKVTPKLHVTR